MLMHFARESENRTVNVSLTGMHKDCFNLYLPYIYLWDILVSVFLVFWLPSVFLTSSAFIFYFCFLFFQNDP